MKYLYRFFSISCILFSLLSYQRVLADATGFIVKKVQIGDNVISLLKLHQLSETERGRVLSLVPELRSLYLQLDVNYLVKQETGLLEMRLYDPNKDLVFVIKKIKNVIQAKMARAVFKTTILRVEGRVQGSLMSSILAKINSNWVASRFIDAYVMNYNLNRGLDRGAKFWLTTEKKYDGPYFIRYGEVLETSLIIHNHNVQKHFVKLNPEGGVFISENDLIRTHPFYSPVSYLRVSSLFQPNRRHPITKRIQPHLGVDFEMPQGSPIYAASTGLVARYGRSSSAGNYLVLLHPNGAETIYNHMKRIDSKIRRGVKLVAGEKLGEVGCTGYCTKAHLHFSVRQRGRLVDPLKFLRPYPLFADVQLRRQIVTY
ncbi:MAG: M23 family metallopeptidase [Pseudobdellovibrionaceae bacterium]